MGFKEAREAEQVVVRGVRRPVRLQRPEQSIGCTEQLGQQRKRKCFGRTLHRKARVRESCLRPEAFHKPAIGR